MAFDAMFKHGHPLMVDHTPIAFVPAGTVIVTGVAGGLSTLVAHHDLEANILGAAAAGGGVYEMSNGENSPDNTKVHWNAAGKKVTGTGTLVFGYIVSGGGRGIDSKCLVEHRPEG